MGCGICSEVCRAQAIEYTTRRKRK
ncbi:MAG: hypothetical protein Q6352_003825 [Candidatus Freyrarchaeum guaymaensis]|nr:hypothetical protein [Candidatus Sigynarchaeota archaeon]